MFLSSSIPRFALSLLCATAIYYSLLFARSQFLLLDPTVPSFTEAIKLVPNNPAGYAALSRMQPDQATALLKRAINLNQFDAPTWIRLGFAAEFQDRDLPLAEKSYLRAEQINRSFYPRSNLVNFYFRQQRVSEFKHWLPLALEMNSSNPSLLFAELWGLSNDGPANSKLIPDRPEVLLAYANFLLDTHRFDAAELALDRAMTLMSGKEPTSLLAKYVPSVERNIDFFSQCLDRLLEANRPQGAQRLASALFAKQVLPYPAPTPAKPLTNGDFRIAAFHHGFDWVFSEPLGVRIDQFTDTAKLRLTFSGQQPENWRLLQQYVLLAPKAEYRMNWEAESDTVPKNSGFTWRLIPIVTKTTDSGPVGVPDTAAAILSPDVFGETSATVPAADVPPSEGPNSTPAAPSVSSTVSSSWTFTAPAVPLSLLVFEYHRNLGTTRPEGELSLRAVSLTLFPPH